MCKDSGPKRMYNRGKMHRALARVDRSNSGLLLAQFQACDGPDSGGDNFGLL